MKIYELVSNEQPVTQGDILDRCPVTLLEAKESSVRDSPEYIQHFARVIVISQACDLVQQQGLGKVVVALVHTCNEILRLGLLKASAIKDHVRFHRMPGWYYLPKADDPASLPESIVDLRDLHTIPRVYLDGLIADSRRICRLGTPFREHLNQHFAVTYMRIGLPEPYATET